MGKKIFCELDVKKAVEKIKSLCSCEGCNPIDYYNSLKLMGIPAQKMIDELLMKNLIRFDVSSMTLRPTKEGWKM